MQIHVALAAIVLGAAFSPAALAAAAATGPSHTMTHLQMADRCSVLESQFRTVTGDRHDQADLKRAASLDSTGTAECNANEGVLGVAKLEQALIDLGAKPVT